MRKLVAVLLSLICFGSLMGCGSKPAETIKNSDGNLKAYSEMTNGTWQAEDYTYKYKFEICGRMPKAATNTTFVYLSNLESISFEQAWKGAGFSSNSADYFDPADAVLVEIKSE